MVWLRLRSQRRPALSVDLFPVLFLLWLLVVAREIPRLSSSLQDIPTDEDSIDEGAAHVVLDSKEITREMFAANESETFAGCSERRRVTLCFVFLDRPGARLGALRVRHDTILIVATRNMDFVLVNRVRGSMRTMPYVLAVQGNHYKLCSPFSVFFHTSRPIREVLVSRRMHAPYTVLYTDHLLVFRSVTSVSCNVTTGPHSNGRLGLTIESQAREDKI